MTPDADRDDTPTPPPRPVDLADRIIAVLLGGRRRPPRRWRLAPVHLRRR